MFIEGLLSAGPLKALCLVLSLILSGSLLDHILSILPRSKWKFERLSNLSRITAFNPHLSYSLTHICPTSYAGTLQDHVTSVYWAPAVLQALFYQLGVNSVHIR